MTPYKDFHSFNKYRESPTKGNDGGDEYQEGAASPVAAAERSLFCDFNSCIDDSMVARDPIIP